MVIFQTDIIRAPYIKKEKIKTSRPTIFLVNQSFVLRRVAIQIKNEL